MNRLITSLFVLCFAVTAWAQKVTISGTVVDNEGEPLPGATVVVMQTDSSQVTGQSTKNDGTFSIAGIKVGEHLVRTSYVGYKTVFQRLTLMKQNRTRLL